jgi:NADPH2:quinone reductase
MLVLFGQSSGPVPPVDPATLASRGSLFLTRPSLAHYVATRDELLWRSREVFAAVAAGVLRPRIGGTYPLTRAADAHRDLESRRTVGKLVLTID